MNACRWLVRCSLVWFVLLGSSSVFAQSNNASEWGKVFLPTAHARPLNLSDPATLAAYHDMLRVAGVIPATREQLYRLTSEKTAPTPADGEPVFALLGFATDDKGATVSSSALIATRLKTHSITLTLVVTDANGKVVARGMRDDKNGPSSMVVNAEPGANATNSELTAVGTASVIYADGSSQVYYVTGEAQSYPIAIKNTAPAINQAAPKNTLVQVCINKATAPNAPPEACNYVLASTADMASVQMPVIGSATFPADIDVDASGKPKDASVSLLVVDPRSDATCQYVDLSADFFTDPSTKVNKGTLSWSLDPTKFDPACTIADVPYLFALSIQVSVQGKQAWATVTNAVTANTTTTIEVPAVHLVAGCIAKGTEVTLADGTLRTVEKLKVGDRLKGESDSLKIAAIASGGKRDAVTFTLDDGNTLRVSLIHPVPTGRGVIQAQELRLGDSVTTLSGAAKVTKIVAETLAQPMQVYDLVLMPAKVSPEQGSTFYAGGILVGDGAMKAALLSARAANTAKEHQP